MAPCSYEWASNENSRGNCRHGKLTIGRMSDFDKLPFCVREPLRYADHNWSGTQCLRELRKRKGKRHMRGAAHAVLVIHESDARQHIHARH
jgi:Family of unknown function (DUF6525)